VRGVEKVTLAELIEVARSVTEVDAVAVTLQIINELGLEVKI
jgi:hypothetical protein